MANPRLPVVRTVVLTGATVTGSIVFPTIGKVGSCSIMNLGPDTAFMSFSDNPAVPIIPAAAAVGNDVAPLLLNTPYNIDDADIGALGFRIAGGTSATIVAIGIGRYGTGGGGIGG